MKEINKNIKLNSLYFTMFKNGDYIFNIINDKKFAIKKKLFFIKKCRNKPNFNFNPIHMLNFYK